MTLKIENAIRKDANGVATFHWFEQGKAIAGVSYCASSGRWLGEWGNGAKPTSIKGHGNGPALKAMATGLVVLA